MSQQYDPYSNPPGVAPNSTLAVVSLIAGILGMTILPGIASIIAIITGHMAKREIRESGGRLGGDGLATVGLATGYFAVVGGLLIACCVLSFIFVLPALGIAIDEFSLMPLILNVL